MRLDEIRIRDPFILPVPEKERYYLFYSCRRDILCLESRDLINWELCGKAFENGGRYNLNWAPEIHFYKGAYYLFATLRKPEGKRGCYILRSEEPFGPYREYSSRITSEEWSCLDGTLYLDESGAPYMVYCHEYIDFADRNGEMRVVKLNEDLTAADGEDTLLFRARDNTVSPNGVTDAPYIYKMPDGGLTMFWSKYIDQNYIILSANSEKGIMGPWIQNTVPVFSENGGHAMVFRDFDGRDRIAFHMPNAPEESERAVIRLLNRNTDGFIID